jgi:quinol monooxygenase YgiN
MAIYQTAYYQVKTDAIEDCKHAIVTFVDYVKAHELGTEMYMSWQQKSDPTCFVHLFKFKDSEAQKIHGQSAAVKKFEAVYKPVLVSNGVTFTDYELVATNY